MLSFPVRGFFPTFQTLWGSLESPVKSPGANGFFPIGATFWGLLGLYLFPLGGNWEFGVPFIGPGFLGPFPVVFFPSWASFRYSVSKPLWASFGATLYFLGVIKGAFPEIHRGDVK